MATPQSQPLLITDPELDIYYFYVSRNWTKVKAKDEQTEITLVSVAGGGRDFFIPEKLTRWPDNTIQTSVRFQVANIYLSISMQLTNYINHFAVTFSSCRLGFH